MHRRRLVAASLGPIRFRPLAEAWNGLQWSIMPVTMPPDDESAKLMSVSCPSVTLCVALGIYKAPFPPEEPLAEVAEVSDRGHWRAETMAQPVGGASADLTDLSCATMASCVAVGDDPKLAESWNGKVWSYDPMVAPPGRANELFVSVSCPSATFCMAVGDGDLTEDWDGTQWSVQNAPSPPGEIDAMNSYLNGVSCVSATSCLAIGMSILTATIAGLTEYWNGHVWTVEPGLVADYQNSSGQLSCASATSCTAAISLERVALEHWDGSRWNAESTPRPNVRNIEAVSCPSTTSCTAVGGQVVGHDRFGPLAERN
jgi:hypothetical protein